MLIREAIEKYLRWKTSYTKRAHEVYPIHLNRFLEIVGDKQIGDLDVSDIIRYIQFYTSRYSTNHTALALTIIKNFLRFLFRSGEKTINPELVKIPKREEYHRHAVSWQEFQTLMNSIRESEFYWLQKKLVCSLLYDTGMRLNELTTLNIDDIKEEKINGEIKRYAIIKTEKSNQQGLVFWSERTENLLKKYLGVRLCLNQQHNLFLASEKHNSRGRPQGRTIERWVKQCVREAGLPKEICVHSFRHGRAHRILELKGDAIHIQKILRHKDISSTESYLRLNVGELHEIAKMFLK